LEAPTVFRHITGTMSETLADGVRQLVAKTEGYNKGFS